MNEKLTIYIATSEWNGYEGIFVTSKPFRTIKEAKAWADKENECFISTYGEDCETDRNNESGIYTSYYDYYLNVDISKHEL